MAARLFAVISMLLAAGCSQQDPEQAPRPLTTESPPAAEPAPAPQPPAMEKPAEHRPGFNTDKPIPSLTALNIREARLEGILSGLEYPWAFTFIAERRLLINEKPGRMSVYDLDEKKMTAVSGVPPVVDAFAQTGLLDIELHPHFRENNRLYFSYVTGDAATRIMTLAVATAIFDGTALQDMKNILLVEPYGWSLSNFGGALEFDNDGHLYISVGDRSENHVAQQGHLLTGKILRLNDDGTTPAENPFIGDPSVDDRIFALGVRNPQGLYFDKASGNLYEAEHGPMGGDELNRIEAGRNYGWPVITYGKMYTLEGIGMTAEQAGVNTARFHYLTKTPDTASTATHMAGMEQPIYYWLPSEAISPLTMYRGAMFPEWNGHFLAGALRGQHISKLDYADGVIRSEHEMLTEVEGRIRDIEIAADGSIYFITQAGSLYRLYRLADSGASAAVDTSNPGAIVYRQVCAGCHDSGAGGAPIPGREIDWIDRRRQPPETIYRHTLDGFNTMPARGFCNLCSDEYLKAAADYMLTAQQG